MNVQKERLEKVHSSIARACAAAGRRADEVALIAVSKNHPADSVKQLYQLGQADFGENRLQEAMAKQQELSGLAITWHFIGPVQSNKTRDIAARFDWVQSVDREKILRRLSDQRPEHLPPLNICLQVNIDREPQKAGLEPGLVVAMAAVTNNLPGIRLRGLMCIPRLVTIPAEGFASFTAMRKLFLQLQELGHGIDTLSMGMSSDLEPAIEHGSTMVRIGTDLFGPRQP